MKWIWTFLVSFSCFGQIPVQTMQPFFNGTRASSNPLLANVQYLWVSSDLGSNATISGNWVDRIVGSNWLMAAAANQPTNTGSTNGVWFDQTHYLTNNGLTISSNVSFGFIVKIIDDGRFTTGGANDQPTLITGTTNGTGQPIRLGTVFRDGVGRDFPVENLIRGDATAYFFNNTTAILTNKWVDIIYTQAVTNNSTQVGQFTAYTNGVQGLQYNAINMKGSWGSVGVNTGVNTGPTNNFPQFLMFNQQKLSSLSAFLREMWVWGNYTNGMLDSGSVSNFHWWRTNTYGP